MNDEPKLPLKVKVAVWYVLFRMWLRGEINCRITLFPLDIYFIKR